MSATTARAALGKRVPDLVLVMDSDPTKPPEFRVQCEVILEPAEATAIYDALYGSGPRDVTEAHRKIKSKLTADQVPQFHAIIDAAFRGNGSQD